MLYTELFESLIASDFLQFNAWENQILILINK